MKNRLFILVTLLLALAAAPVSATSLSIDQIQGSVTTSEIKASGHPGIIQELGWFPAAHYNSRGELIWAGVAFNALANEGEQSILSVYFRAGTAPTGFYLRLYNTTPTGTSTLSTLASSEPATANGYNPANNSLARNSTDWPTLALVSSHYEVTSKTVSITASGGTIGPVTNVGLASTSDNTGILVSFAALSTTRTLQAGDTLQMTKKVRLQ
jgi:hypothetical protein